MKKSTAGSFRKLLQPGKKVSIITHWSPDGDAMGSSLALYGFLKKLKLKPQVIVPNDYPDFLKWLPGDKQVINFEANESKAVKALNSSELIFTLDFNSLKRIEKLGDLLRATSTPIVLIDHHREPEDYASYFYFDVNACSTCELVFELISSLGKKALIDKNIASCLYTGLMTDTGSFRYPSVSSKTHLIVSELLKTGIKPTEIHSAVYDTYSESRMKLLGYSLSEKMTVIPGSKVAYIALTGEELKRFDFKKGDTEGLVNYPFSINGINVCVLFNESEKDGYVKISFRSKGKIDVNTFARKYFNGGGHLNAAGGKSFDSLHDTVDRFIRLSAELKK